MPADDSNYPPIRVMRSAALLALWEVLETANQGHILKLLNACGIKEHKFNAYVLKVGEHDTSPKFKKYGTIRYSNNDWSKR